MSHLERPMGVEVVLTHRCNHRCIHCYDPFARVSDVLDADWKGRCDRVIQQLSVSGVTKVILTGGEPLLAPDILMYMIQGLYDHEIDVSLNSNLTLIDDDIASRLASMDPVPFILTSLPSIDPEGCDEITRVSGSFARITEGIEICGKNGLDVGINIVASGYSEYDYERLSEYLGNHPNIRYLAISPVIPQCCRLDDDKLYLDESEYIHIDGILKRISDEFDIRVGSTTPMPLCITGYDHRTRDFQSMCSAGRIQCVVDMTTGSVLACAHSDTSYGNIYNEGLLDTWARMGDWRDDSRLSVECRKCPSLTICGGECRMMYGLSRKRYSLNPNTRVILPEPEPLDKSLRYRVSDRLKIRYDGDTGALLVDNHGYMRVRKPVLDMLDLMISMGEFGLSDLEGLVEINDFFIISFRNLLNMGVIEKV